MIFFFFLLLLYLFCLFYHSFSSWILYLLLCIELSNGPFWLSTSDTSAKTTSFKTRQSFSHIYELDPHSYYIVWLNISQKKWILVIDRYFTYRKIWFLKKDSPTIYHRKFIATCSWNYWLYHCHSCLTFIFLLLFFP